MTSIRRAAQAFCLAPLLLATVAQAQSTCVVPLAAVGPIDPSHGFPTYYRDSNDVALQPCLDFVCDPALGLPDPTLPVSFPDNFPGEFFYSRAISKLSAPGVLATLVLALQGTFLNGAPVPGDQMVFARVRVRASGLARGRDYIVTYPYGVLTLHSNALGTINFTRDMGAVPQQFQLALTGDVGPFLSFASGAIPPPPGTIGNPAANQTVTGSPCGTNFFRIEGPRLPVGGLQTDLFSTLIGKLAPSCGNGVLDPGEECDDGNTFAGDCCSPTCQIDLAGTPCDDGSFCTTGDACSGGTPTCVGTPINCNDGNFCTTDSCDPARGCLNAANTNPCSDGNACTVGDACANGACVSGTPTNCDDGNPCTTDSCDPAGGCLHVANTNPCSDGNPCTVGDACANGVCVGTPTNCDDGNPCTADSCDPVLGCLHANTTAPCSDGNACTVGDTCSLGTCVAGSAVNCDDGNVCTDDSCSPSTGCLHTPNTAPCDDGNPLTLFDTCSGGRCVGIVPLVAPLVRTAGENPSVSAAFPAAGDGRWGGTTVRVTLGNLDPKRYPSGAACRADVTAGVFVGTGTMLSGVAPGSAPPLPVTVLEFLRTGTVRAGDRVTLRIRCTVGGIRHETSWQGLFAALSAPSAAAAVRSPSPSGLQIVGPRPPRWDGARQPGRPGRHARRHHLSRPRR